jgi:tetratricopeptide (TPR) repeat protein
VLAEVPGIEPAEVADHWRAAARPDQEVAHRVAAARRADERFAPPESLSAWLRVLELMDSGEFADGTELYDVLVAALEAAGQITDVDAVRVLARRLGALDLPDARRAVALRWMALSEIGDGRSERGLSLLDEALRLLEQQPPSRQLEKLSADRLGTFMDLGRLDDARVEMSRGLAVREALGDPRSRPWCAMSAWVTLWSGDLDGAVAMAREALASEWPDVDPIGDMQLACATTDVMLHAASPAREVEEAARDTLREIEDYHLTHSNGGVTLRANLALAYLSQGDVAAAREWVRPITRSEPFDPNTAFVHHVLGAIELREGHVQTALDRCRTAAAQIPNHGQNWVVNVPLHAEVELWARQHRPALDLLDEAVKLTLPTQGLLTAELVGMHARGHADQLDAGGATDSDRRRRVEELRATVARARSDPFAAPIRDAAVPAASRWWRAELSRIVGTATLDEWVAVAAEWDRILRVHDAAYSRWRAGQVALREGQGTLAARLLRWAATDARTHEPLARAIALTASGG